MVRWTSASAKLWNGAVALKSNPWASAAMQCVPAGATWSRPAAGGLGLGLGPTGRIHSPGRGDPTQWLDRAIGGTTPILMGSALGPPWRPIFCGNNDPRPIAQQLGTPSRGRPSWMPSLWCAATCGWRLRVFHCPPPTLIYGKSRPLCTTGLPVPLLTLLELRKVQVRAGRGVGMGPGPAFARGCWRRGCCAVMGGGVPTGGAAGWVVRGRETQKYRGQAE